MTTDFVDEDGLPGPASPAVAHTESTGPTSWRQRLTPAFVNVLILGACFFLLFFSYNTTQNFVTTVNGKVGFWSLALLYGAFSVANLFSAIVVFFLGERLSLMGGAALYTLFIGANIYVIDWVLLPISFLMGIGAAVLWTAQGSMLTKCSTKETMGFHSGVFWAMFQFNGVLGNIFAASLLSAGLDTGILFGSLFVVAAIASVSFIVLRPAPKPAAVDGVASSDDDAKDKKLNPLATLQLFRDERMMFMALIMIYSGLTQSFFTGAFPPVFGKDIIGWVLAVFSFFDTVASILAGRISDSVGRRAVFIFTGFTHFVGLLLVGVSLGYGADHRWLYYITMAVLGVADAGLNTQLYAVLGSFFPRDPDAAFAFFKFFQATSTAAAMAYSSVLAVNLVLGILFLFLIPGMVMLLLMDRYIMPLNSTSEGVEKSLN